MRGPRSVLRGLSLWSLLCAYLSTITAGASSHYIVDGCSGSTCGGEGDNGKPVECASDDATKGSTMGDTDTDHIAVQCCAINGPYADRVGCVEGVSFDVAEAHCENNGHRLCTKDEVLTDIGKRTGCGFNDDHVWTSTPCSLPTVFDPSPSPTRSPSPEPTPSPNQPPTDPTPRPTTPIAAPTAEITAAPATTDPSQETTAPTFSNCLSMNLHGVIVNENGMEVCSFSCDWNGDFTFYGAADCNGEVAFKLYNATNPYYAGGLSEIVTACSPIGSLFAGEEMGTTTGNVSFARAVDEVQHSGFDTFESDEEATDSDSNLLAVLAASSAFVAVVCISVALLYALRRKHSGEEAKVADEMIVEEDVPDHTDVSVEMITETPVTM